MNANLVRDLVLEPDDNQRLANLCGQFDEHLKQIERRLGVQVRPRGNLFQLEGPTPAVEAAERLLVSLFEQAAEENISPQVVHTALQESGLYAAPDEHAPGEIRTRRGVIRGRGPNQGRYLESMREHDLCFGIGPAGTGKTYLAVARAVEALESDEVRRIVLVRPAVEAGERLGFLPGDMSQKVDPYLRPMYDALYEMLGFERVAKLMERHVIEVAPLAFMRGRTLNEAFVILDEAQNSTVEQMKMFLTRIGFGSRAVVTGDVTQTDLPANKVSGLRHASRVLQDVEGVGFTWFTARDVVRHPLVQRIVEAYQRHQEDEA
ncbi:PhoH family protein [Thioalkalivibrio sp. XN279]|uniref:PhoH family protein n=1 Tax=Thioalkalivibrio sp. XN279 TaxID=2714953 RepID=UPI00140C38C4|nr:PhoH family protein [Thioalkalivibrio sp. XN279]NHA15190.1 PhoH family protein [Thioalkalivibrio sp. XN279]